MKSLVCWLGWACFTAVLLWLLLFIATGEQFTFVRLLSYMAPWMAGLLLIFALAAFLLRRRRQGAITALMAVLLLLPYSPRFMPSGSGDVDAGALHRQVYKVMTYSKMGRNHDIDAVARVVMAEKPDILFMQEIDATESKRLIKELKREYKNGLSVVHDHVGLVLSRFKIESEDDTHSAIVAVPDGNIRVWNVHLQKSIGRTGIQYRAVDQLTSQIDRVDGPVLVAGDFNATTINYPCVKINQYLDDAFESAGFGFGFTFSSPARRLGMITPFMRIDHIYYSKHFVAQKAYVVNDAGGSDHYPVVALLSLKSNAMTTGE